jgi:hypothetical protein
MNAGKHVAFFLDSALESSAVYILNLIVVLLERIYHLVYPSQQPGMMYPQILRTDTTLQAWGRDGLPPYVDALEWDPPPLGIAVL